MLEISDLTVKVPTAHGNLPVLNGVNLSVKKGEIWGIVGESGSGKSTLALTVMGMSAGIVTGSVKFRGEELLHKSSREWEKVRGSSISMVRQQSGEMLTPMIPLIDQVMEPSLKELPYQKEEAYQRAARLLSRVGLGESFFYRYPFTLSGGEVQKALLAMALVTDPELLILDEPVSSLDALTKSEILDLLEELSDERTVLVISHDLSTVARLASETAVLYCGSILEKAPTSSCLQTPLHPYTRSLVRAYPTLDGPRELQGIRGEFPSLSERPGGCPFHPRCTQSLEVCAREHPQSAPAEVNSGWFLSCHRGGVIELLRGRGLTQRYSLNGLNGVPGSSGSSYLEAVSGVNVSLREGEVYALVGESGSGKSTLGRILAGVDPPFRGEVFFQGTELRRFKGRAKKELSRDLQMLFQNAGEALSHRLTVSELVAEPLIIQKIGDEQSRREAVCRSLEWVELPTNDHFLNEYPHHLSGGELQRVALARALVLEPRLLIADEPSASLDASVQAKVIKLLLHLQNERGFALFLITHDLALAARAGDRIGVMQAGRIVEEATPSRIIHHPGHPYTQSLLSSGFTLFNF